MAGKKGKSGRPKLPGHLYRLYIRYRPGIDPPELKEILETIENAHHYRRTDIFKAAVAGGLEQTRAAASVIESGATATLLNDMFADF